MKTTLLTIILLIKIFYSNGQIFESIGVKGGISFANLTCQYIEPTIVNKYDYKMGIYTVLTAELFKASFLSLNTDFGMVQKGMQEKIMMTTVENPEGNGEYTTWKITLDYITFSPMIKGFYDFSRLNTYVLIGPRIDYQIRNKSNYDSRFDNDLNKITWGLTYGAGAEYKINKFGILLELFGNHDFSTLMNDPPTATTSGLKITGKTYIITSGLKYYFH